MSKLMFDRRAVLAGVATLSGGLTLTRAIAQSLPQIRVNRDPSCGCCGAWVDHLRQSGFAVDVIETAEITRLKVRLAVPQGLASCHTAEVDGYVIEGHVPAPAIKRLLNERPHGKGLAVPGMPIGSPGMEIEGSEAETYEVVLFGPSGQRIFARFRGAIEA